MKINDIFENRMYVDNPGGDWLKGKQENAKKTPRRPSGAPHMGSVTAYFKDDVVLPVDVLKKIPGMNMEQSNVRKHSLDWLLNHMKSTGRLPEMIPGEEYTPFIVVDFEGQPWVNEGNHRIMAAAKLGWKELPVELRYFDGGEDVKSGPLYPGKWGFK